MNSKHLLKGHFGLEREGVRVDEYGEISSKKHPKVFTESNPFITRDFAEAQIEMITPPLPSIDDAEAMLLDIQNIVLRNLEGEYLWKQSTPPILRENVEVAEFESDPEKDEYRKYLSRRYGKEKSIISGVHFNASFDESLIKMLFEKSSDTDYVTFKNNLYLKISKYILKERWFFIYLTNASPVFHKSYYQHCVDNSVQLDNGDCYIEGMKSIRNSSCGYRNEEDFILDFSSLSNYNERVKEIVESGDITQPSELYSPVRLKLSDDGNIQYLEIRFLDINPFTKSGVSSVDLKYLHLFIIKYALMNDFDFNEQDQKEATNRHDEVTRLNGCPCIYETEMLKLHDSIKQFASDKDLYSNTEEIFNSIEHRIKDQKNTYAERLKRKYEKSNYIEHHLMEAKDLTKNIMNHPFVFESNKDLELSTKILIQEAIKQGYDFEILDESTNFISLIDPKTNQKEYIQQATKTNLDRYANVLAMENKIVTKKILSNHKIKVPHGDVLKSVDDLKYIDLNEYDQGIVIKPNTTNFGEGITIYTNKPSLKQISQAVEFALTKDDTILLEQFIKGKEYRFLVIDNEVTGVLHRRAANIVGDGVSSISELVNEKNKHPYRGKNYKTPLERIELKAIEKEFLSLQGYDQSSIIEKDKRIYLRENSNISTGGDSVDVTDFIHPSYITIAEEASKALDINISGVDIIIEDVEVEANDENYCILELNFNPAIHIHTYPLEGMDRKPSEKIINALFKNGRK